jgi:hypothetical protein
MTVERSPMRSSRARSEASWPEPPGSSNPDDGSRLRGLDAAGAHYVGAPAAPLDKGEATWRFLRWAIFFGRCL